MQVLVNTVAHESMGPIAIRYRGLLHCTQQILKTEGIKGLYKVFSKLNFIYFVLFPRIKSFFMSVCVYMSSILGHRSHIRKVTR